MTISERTLKKWRAEALLEAEVMKKFPLKPSTVAIDSISHEFLESLHKNNNRILTMTQELLDQKLLERKEK